VNYLKLAQQRRNEIEHYWPENVFLPLEEWYRLLKKVSPDEIAKISEMSIKAPYRFTRSIYRFDETLLDALLSTQLKGDIPAELLTRLPEWTIYMDIDDGVYASLDYVLSADYEMELRVWSNDIPIMLPLGPWTVSEGLSKFLNHIGAAAALPPSIVEQAQHMMSRYLPLIMYICSDGVEYSGDQRPSHPAPVRTRRDGWKLFPATRDRVWRLGEKSGRVIRESRGSLGSRKGPAPHIRRAHWHTLRNGQVKFFPPIPVAHNT